MQRYDRAIFTILLLALLTDIARAAAPVTGLPADGFILAAAQLPAQSSTASLLGVPASTLSRPRSRLSVLSRWPHLFRVAQSSSSLALAAIPELPVSTGSAVAQLDLPSESASPAFFEHVASPAP